MSKQEMLKKIYEVIADKTLSFGCRVVYTGCEYTISRNTGIRQAEYIIINSEGELGCSRFDKIIGHPVMIGDVLNYIDGITPRTNISQNILDIVFIWGKKNEPIEDQSEECIRFIYNLINNDTK